MYFQEGTIAGNKYKATSDGNFSFKVFKGDDVAFDYFIENVPKTQKLFHLLVSLSITKFKVELTK